jgi:hypothetical protein
MAGAAGGDVTSEDQRDVDNAGGGGDAAHGGGGSPGMGGNAVAQGGQGGMAANGGSMRPAGSCESSSECGGQAAICNLNRGRCVQCLTANDCGSGPWTCNSAGACVCASPRLACGDVCADPATDARHCGACGHDCLGGTCAVFQCQPVTLVAASSTQTRYDLAVGPARVYWSNNATGSYSIASVPLGGGPITTFGAALTGPPQALALSPDKTTLYFAAAYKVFKAPLDGMPVAAGFNDCGPDGIAAIAVNDSVLACSANADNWLNIVSLRDGAVRVVRGFSTTRAVALSKDRFYWTAEAAVYTTSLGAMDSGAPIVSGGQPFDLAINSTSIFWTNPQSALSRGPGVWKAALTGADPVQLATSAKPAGIAVDERAVFFTDNQMAGGVFRVSVDGGGMTQIAADQNGPLSIALDATAVYWINSGSGEIMKVAR